MTHIKICGVTTVDQAGYCVEAGASAIGVNFVESSPRRVDIETARDIVRAIGSRALVVGVVAGMTVDAMRATRDASGVGCLQLHGDESPDDVAALLPHAYKALRISSVEDVARADTMPGDYVLVDTKVDGTLGGTGRTFDWSLAVALAARRRVVLAGGLTPANVAQAVRMVRPWCVDVASGVENAPGVKAHSKVRAFVDAVRQADREG